MLRISNVQKISQIKEPSNGILIEKVNCRMFEWVMFLDALFQNYRTFLTKIL